MTYLCSFSSKDNLDFLDFLQKKFNSIDYRSVANLIKHFTMVNYDARVVLATNLPMLQLRVIIS